MQLSNAQPESAEQKQILEKLARTEAHWNYAFDVEYMLHHLSRKEGCWLCKGLVSLDSLVKDAELATPIWQQCICCMHLVLNSVAVFDGDQYYCNQCWEL